MEGGVEGGAAVAEADGPGAAAGGGRFEAELATLDEEAVLLREGRVGAELEALDGGIDEAAGAAAFQRLFAEEGPGLQGFADAQTGAARAVLEHEGETPVENFA